MGSTKESNIFEVYIKGGGIKGKDEFVANAFAIEVDGNRELLTADHVIKSAIGRPLRFKSRDGSELIKQVNFQNPKRIGDLAVARVYGNGGLKVAEEKPTIGSNLNVDSTSFASLFRNQNKVKVISVHLDTLEFQYNENEVAEQGSLGAPILNDSDEVVAVQSFVEHWGEKRSKGQKGIGYLLTDNRHTKHFGRR